MASKLIPIARASVLIYAALKPHPQLSRNARRALQVPGDPDRATIKKDSCRRDL